MIPQSLLFRLLPTSTQLQLNTIIVPPQEFGSTAPPPQTVVPALLRQLCGGARRRTTTDHTGLVADSGPSYDLRFYEVTF